PAEETETDPADFSTFSLDTLRGYRKLHKLAVPPAYTVVGEMLRGPEGKKSISYKTSQSRISKNELAAQCKRHFLNQPVKENETIVDFLYTVRNQGKDFRLKF
ncbi:hypothetical protein CANCADRAFT_15567, partial [Tortispora caseinolytica NRRL Y-17796]